MLFKKTAKKGDHLVEKEGVDRVMHINYENSSRIPSIEDDSIVMIELIEKLAQTQDVERIVYHQRKKYEYGFKQVQLLIEIATIYNHFIKQRKIFSRLALTGASQETIQNLQYLVMNLLKSDPVGCYVESRRFLRDEKIFTGEIPEMLQELHDLLENTKLIKLADSYLEGFQIGDRTVYKAIFKPAVTPDFMYTRMMAIPPIEALEVDSYQVSKNTYVQIYDQPSTIKKLYHLIPPEFQISEDKYELIELARKVLAEHKPKAEEFLDTDRMRQTFFNIGRDLLIELADTKGISLKFDEIEELANVLVRYTVGFGLIEVLLQDPNVQDIVINSPVGENPIFLVHSVHDECVTNLVPSVEDVDGWATKFRLISARPLDEANPILDTEMEIPGARARVAAVGKPLNPYGVSYAIRRHRDKPWTLSLFIKNGMITPLAAGVLSFLIEGSRTMLIAGTRSSGKSSILGSVMVEIMRKHRIISVEDTLELPTSALSKLGFNIQPMKVRSALLKSGSEVAADEGIRTSLRLGDSALIIGEVRSSIRGNEEVLIVEKGITKRVKIEDLEGRELSNFLIPTMDSNLKFKLKKLVAFVKHPQRKALLRVTTRTGREITVTPDHSLFTHKDFRIVPIECKNLKVGEKIIIPEKLPTGYNQIKSFNLLSLLKDDNCRLVGYEEDLREIIKKIGYKKATEVCELESDIYVYLRNGVQHTNIPISHFLNLCDETNHNFDLTTLQIRKGTSGVLPAEIPLTKELCRFLGYYVAEGYTQENGSVVFSNHNDAIKKDIIQLGEKLFGISPFVRLTESLGVSTQISFNNRILGLFFKKLGCGRVSFEKRVPEFIFGLSEEMICEFLKGYFDGDGSQTSIESTGNRISCATVSKNLANDLIYLFLQLGIVARTYTKNSRGIGKRKQYIVEFKMRKYVKLFLEKVGFKKYSKKLIERQISHSTLNVVNYDIDLLEQNVKLKRKFRHLRRYNSVGKDYLKKVVEEADFSTDLIKTFVNGDFFLDEVKSIKKINLDKGESVYDLSVEPFQNFIGGFGGLMLHNTEALAMFEAMRVGALANVVAGTIHGDSPYGVFDRLVNDLKVPKTSFKAIDIMVIANPIKSGDGMHRKRRVVSITEVRKYWDDDPLREGAFVDLFKYDPESDALIPTDALLNGDSEIIKAIGGSVKDFAGSWDAIWENIILRSNIKELQVKYSNDFPSLLEAEATVFLNDEFHRISDRVKRETGYLDSKRILFDWEESLKKYLKKEFQS